MSRLQHSVRSAPPAHEQVDLTPVTRADAETLAALALAVLYLAVMSAHSYSIDGVLMFRQASSIVDNFSLRFAEPIYWGELFSTSKYGIGLSLLYVPTEFVVNLLGFREPVPSPNAYDWDLFYRDAVYAVAGAPVHVGVTATIALLVARLVRQLGYDTKTAIFALASFGVASPAIVYARGDFAQPLLGLCLVAGVLSTMRFCISGRAAPLAVAAGSLCLAVLTRPVEGSLLFPALLLLVIPSLKTREWSANTIRAVVVLGAAYVLAFALTLLVNWGRYGSPLSTGYTGISWGTPFWIGVPGVLISPARGILWQFPLILLLPLGAWRVFASRHRPIALAGSFLVLALFLNTALWVPWWGAWSWGSRLFVPAWPLIAVFAAVGTANLRPALRGWLPAVLLAGGVIWAIPGSVTDLLGGYASAYNDSAASFRLSGYPPIGAWTFVHHVRAVTLSDSSAVDIVWFRLARKTNDLSVLVLPAFLGISAWLAWASAKRIRTPRVETGVASGATNAKVGSGARD